MQGENMVERQIKNYAAAEQFLEEVPKFAKKNPLEDTRKFYMYIQNCSGGKYCEECHRRLRPRTLPGFRK